MAYFEQDALTASPCSLAVRQTAPDWKHCARCCWHSLMMFAWYSSNLPNGLSSCVRSPRQMTQPDAQPDCKPRTCLHRWLIASAYFRSNGNWKISVFDFSNLNFINALPPCSMESAMSARPILAACWSNFAPRWTSSASARILRGGPNIFFRFTEKCNRKTSPLRSSMTFGLFGFWSIPSQIVTPYWASHTISGGRFKASSMTISPSRRPTITSLCILLSSGRRTRRLKCRFVPAKCIRRPNTASLRTGVTKKARRIKPLQTRSLSPRFPGCGRCWNGNASWLTRADFPNR